MMPPTGTLNGCDCPESLSTSVNGVLIDDVIPSIDTTQHGTWATELFVVNRNGQDSFTIGFQFNIDIHLRGVEVTYFCLLYTSPSPRDATLSRMPSSA